MNRREFLEMLGLTAVATAVPKLIFDMGANSHLYTPKLEIIRREFTSLAYSLAEIQGAKEFEETFGKITQELYRQSQFFKQTAVDPQFFSSLEKTLIGDSCVYRLPL